VWIAGESDGSDPGGALMQKNTEEEQMQYGRRGGMLRAAHGRCDWFAYGVDVCLLLMPVSESLLKQDSSRLLLIRNVI
jgi:hypothetical protein